MAEYKAKKTVESLWSKYRTALQKLEWALDQLEKKPKVQVDWYENTDKINFLQDQYDKLKDKYNQAVERIEKQNDIINNFREVNKIEVKDHTGNLIEVFKPGEEPQPVPKRVAGQEQIVIPDLSIHAEEETPPNAGFGTKFPDMPGKGDMFLRVDMLPSKLFKWNEKKWIEVDKISADSYAYDIEYIKHLAERVAKGEYDTELLTPTESEQIERLRNGTI